MITVYPPIELEIQVEIVDEYCAHDPFYKNRNKHSLPIKVPW